MGILAVFGGCIAGSDLLPSPDPHGQADILFSETHWGLDFAHAHLHPRYIPLHSSRRRLQHHSIVCQPLNTGEEGVLLLCFKDVNIIHYTSYFPNWTKDNLVDLFLRMYFLLEPVSDAGGSEKLSPVNRRRRCGITPVLR